MSAGRCVVPEDACCVFSPQAWWFKKWDVMMIFLLLFVATVTPYEVAFLPEVNLASESPDLMWYFNRFIDRGTELEQRIYVCW